ncbi:hypothetical protein [Deefgea rivuli]|uniref:hypothetical protein n=1 Tax=Deefgea rivuli TaxID=400948 RepID=UPI0004849EC1|nr:hypothetical protein [Deefgea rivuli]
MKTMKNLLFFPLVLIALLLLTLGFFEGRKAYWDNRVQKMCNKDGGTTVFEHVTISRDDALNGGLMRGDLFAIPAGKNEKTIFYVNFESKNIRDSDPLIFRSETSIVRVKDSKIIAMMIGYARVGGDFPSFSHPTHQSCRERSKALINFDKAVQIKEESK